MKIIVSFLGEHSAKCIELAKTGQIPQAINPHLQEWIIKKFEENCSVHDLVDIIEDKSSHAHHGCPIPLVIGPGSRFRPSESTLRSLSSLAKIRRLVDKNETKAVALLVEELKEEGSLVQYNSGVCVCNVSNKDQYLPITTKAADLILN